VRTYSLRTLYSGYDGFAQLCVLAEQLSKDRAEAITLDMASVGWFDANMCAPLGALLSKASRNLNSVTVENAPSSVKQILSKNGFLGNYGFPAVPDKWGTTIPYKRFDPKDDHAFALYIHRHLRGHGMPKMSAALQKKFMESIFEIFSNAVIHSGTTLGIYSCGQYFPKTNRLDFSTVDLGIGIRENLSAKRGLTLSAVDAIKWAINGTNTTKTGAVPGGLGLKLLREFIQLNGGRLVLVSDGGFWEMKDGRASVRSLPHKFPGTVVNLEFNTADTNAYCLQSELKSEDIF
jgi:hypothetical protein